MDELEMYKKALEMACSDLASEFGQSDKVQEFIDEYLDTVKRGIGINDRT